MEDRSGQIVPVNLFFMVLCTIIVGLRVYCRAWIIRNFGMDDWMMLISYVMFIMYLITQLLGVKHGTGKHRKDLAPEDNSRALMWWFACELFYIISTTVLKFSVGFFLLRIAIDKRHIWILRVMMVATFIFGTSYFFLVTFQCHPVASFWEISPRAPGCLPADYVVIMTYTASVLNCIADWTFGILPAFIVWTLSMTKREKIMVGAILSFAAIGSTATIFRFSVIEGLRDGDDFLYATTDIAIWSTVEPGIGIAAASIATLRPFFQLVRYKVGLSQNGPANPGWNERNRTPHRSGYIQSTGASSSIPMQRPNHHYHTSVVSKEDSEGTRHYKIEATPSEAQLRQPEDARLKTNVLETIEVSVTNSESKKTDEFHVHKWGTPWKDEWH